MASIQDLREVYKRLPPAEQATAASLGQGFNRYGSWTPKQQDLVDRLVASVRSQKNLGDLTALDEMFSFAATKKAKPAVVFSTDEGVRIKVQPYKGRLFVNERGAEFGTPAFGVIEGGVYKPRRPDQPASLLSMLQHLARDPAGFGSMQGTLTGECCYCARELTDARSVKVGYGPTCAANFNLPWGEK